MVWRRRRWLLGMRLGRIGPDEEGLDARHACCNSRIAAVICSGVRTRADDTGAEGAIAPEDASTPNAGAPAMWGSSADEDAGGGG